MLAREEGALAPHTPAQRVASSCAQMRVLWESAVRVQPRLKHKRPQPTRIVLLFARTIIGVVYPAALRGCGANVCVYAMLLSGRVACVYVV